VTRAHAVKLGLIVPQPAMAELMRSGLHPCMVRPFWRDVPTLRRGPLMPEWDVEEYFLGVRHNREMAA
jgi:hypothetical protein